MRRSGPPTQLAVRGDARLQAPLQRERPLHELLFAVVVEALADGLEELRAAPRALPLGPCAQDDLFGAAEQRRQQRLLDGGHQGEEQWAECRRRVCAGRRARVRPLRRAPRPPPA